MVQIIQMVDPKADTLRLFTPSRKVEKQKLVINETDPYSRYRQHIFYTRKMLSAAQAKAIWLDDEYHRLRDLYRKSRADSVLVGEYPDQRLCIVNMRRDVIKRRDGVLVENGLPGIF